MGNSYLDYLNRKDAEKWDEIREAAKAAETAKRNAKLAAERAANRAQLERMRQDRINAGLE